MSGEANTNMKHTFLNTLSLTAATLALATARVLAQTNTIPSQPPALASANVAGSSKTAEDQKAAEAELVKKTLNPVASLISVPIQNNWDFGSGPAGATTYKANIQPVIPFSLNDDLNLITRTIMPVIDAESPVIGGKNHSGLGDIQQSFFLSPKKDVGGWIVGAGPLFLYPTATDSALGSGKVGAGPTFVVLKQQSGFTYGLLASHTWSVAGWGDEDINASYLQPFLSYSTKTYTTFSVNTESTYEWQSQQWTVPVNFTVSQLMKIGRQPISFQIGYRCYADGPSGGPEWGLRFGVTFLFPK